MPNRGTLVGADEHFFNMRLQISISHFDPMWANREMHMRKERTSSLNFAIHHDFSPGCDRKFENAGPGRMLLWLLDQCRR